VQSLDIVLKCVQAVLIYKMFKERVPKSNDTWEKDYNWLHKWTERLCRTRNAVCRWPWLSYSNVSSLVRLRRHYMKPLRGTNRAMTSLEAWEWTTAALRVWRSVGPDGSRRPWTTVLPPRSAGECPPTEAPLSLLIDALLSVTISNNRLPALRQQLLCWRAPVTF